MIDDLIERANKAMDGSGPVDLYANYDQACAWCDLVRELVSEIGRLRSTGILSVREDAINEMAVLYRKAMSYGGERISLSDALIREDVEPVVDGFMAIVRQGLR